MAAPVPGTARGRAVDVQKGYLVEGLYWVTDPRRPVPSVTFVAEAGPRWAADR